MGDTFTNFIKRDDFAALREEIERLKAENRELNLDVKMYQEYYVHQNKLFDAQDEIKILKIAKRELVEALEKVGYAQTVKEIYDTVQAAVTKHKQ